MENKKIQKWIEANLFHPDGTPMVNTQTFYEGAKWMRDKILEQKKEPRFFLDVRPGCAAVRDRRHPGYDPGYQGLHSDTPDVLEYRHGYFDRDKSEWTIRKSDIEYLKDYCNNLNL